VLSARILTYLCFLHRRRGDAAATQRYARLGLVAAAELAMPEYVGAAHAHLAWLAWRREDHGACLREGSAALRCWESGQRYTLQWCARLPLLAVMVTQDRLSEAASHAAAMLEPSQQRLPDRLTEALERAVRAGADPDAARPALLRAVTAAADARLL
jgi:eukaryotic-like serine/threonine-protein kinase